MRTGARKLLQEAIEVEVAEYIERFKEERDADGRRLVTRHGHLPARSIQTGLGPIETKQPRVRDKREEESFSSAILPKYGLCFLITERE